LIKHVEDEVVEECVRVSNDDEIATIVVVFEFALVASSETLAPVTAKS
jgi:hypothetical protein